MAQRHGSVDAVLRAVQSDRLRLCERLAGSWTEIFQWLWSSEFGGPAVNERCDAVLGLGAFRSWGGVCLFP